MNDAMVTDIATSRLTPRTPLGTLRTMINFRNNNWWWLDESGSHYRSRQV